MTTKFVWRLGQYIPSSLYNTLTAPWLLKTVRITCTDLQYLKRCF